MNIPKQQQSFRLPLEALERIDALCTSFEESLQRGESPAIEDFLNGVEGQERVQLLLELLLLELAHHSPSTISELVADYEQRFPIERGVVRDALRQHRRLHERQRSDQVTASPEEASLPGPDSAGPSAIPRRLRYLEDYELLEEISRGGMGIIYKARDRRNNRHVAVKLMLMGEHATAEQSERFVREARTAAKLQHPNIVRVYEVGYREGSPYFVMDYVEGQNLETLHENQPISDVQAARFVKTAAQAVAYAHELGILHRDLKPSNLLVDARLRLRVTDFGLAKWVDEGESLTHTGEIMGTPGFMPPEQAAGKKQENRIAFASDVYGLGAILYYLLTGRPPHHGDSVIEVLNSVLNSNPPAPSSLRPSISPELEAICLKCLERNPRKRYPTAADLVQDLENWLLRKPVSDAGADPAKHRSSLIRQFSVSFAATALCLLLFVFLSRGNQWFSAGSADSSPPAHNQSEESGEQLADDTSEREVPANKDIDPPPAEELVSLRADKPEIAQVVQPPENPPAGRAQQGTGSQHPVGPGGLFGPLSRPAWTSAPIETRGMAVVQHMQDFSDKLDFFAELIGRERPRVLQTAMDETQIRAGLNQDGSLLWLAGQMTTDGTPLVYLLPATRFEEMIGRLDPREIKPPHKLRGYHRVQTDGWNFLSKPSQQYGLFVEEPWVNWAEQIVKSSGGFDQKLGSFNDFLQRQDIGFVLTREAIAEGVTIGLPFSDGDYIIPKMMQQLSDLFFELSGFNCMGAGTRLSPLTGITVSGATAIDPQSHAAQWHQSMHYQRDDLLRSLPADPSSLAIASSSCDEWNQWLEILCQDGFGGNFDFSGLRAVSFQIAAKPDSASLSELFHAQIKAEDAHKFFADLQQFLPVVFQQGIAGNEIAVQTDPQPNGQVLRLWVKPERLKWWLAENGYENFCLAMTVLDKHTIVIQGVKANYRSDQVQGKVSLGSVIARLQQQTVSLIDDPKNQATLKMMSPQSQQLVLLDLFGAAVTLNEISKHGNPGGTQSGGYAAIAAGFAGFFQNSPPLGLSNQFASELIEIDVVAPNDLLKPLAEMGLFR